MENRTITEQRSDRELVTTRTFNAPARIVYQAWAKAELFRRWWVPKSLGMALLSCEVDARVGGKYRLEFAHPGSSQPVTFFGSYTEVVPNSRLAWTNEESADGPVTTVTFEEKDGKTLLVMRELYPSKQAMDTLRGGEEGLPESFGQLDELLLTLS